MFKVLLYIVVSFSKQSPIPVWIENLAMSFLHTTPWGGGFIKIPISFLGHKTYTKYSLFSMLFCCLKKLFNVRYPVVKLRSLEVWTMFSFILDTKMFFKVAWGIHSLHPKIDPRKSPPPLVIYAFLCVVMECSIGLKQNTGKKSMTLQKNFFYISPIMDSGQAFNS